MFNSLRSHLPAIARIVIFYRGIIRFPVPLFVKERLEIFGTFGVCVCMCVCTYVCMYVGTYVCIYVRIKRDVLKICRVLTLTSKEVISASANISNVGSY